MASIEKRVLNYLKYSFKIVGCISIHRKLISICKTFPQLIAACIWLINIRIIAVEESVFQQNSEIQLYDIIYILIYIIIYIIKLYYNLYYNLYYYDIIYITTIIDNHDICTYINTFIDTYINNHTI